MIYKLFKKKKNQNKLNPLRPNCLFECQFQKWGAHSLWIHHKNCQFHAKNLKKEHEKPNN